MHFAIDHDLARIFSFDAVDLAANRSGHLSPDQERMFTAAAAMGRRRTRRTVPLVLVLVVTAAMVAVTMSGEVTAALLGTLAVGLGVPVLLIVVFGRKAQRTYAAYEIPVVKTVEGTADAHPSATPGSWWVVIGGVRFPVMSGDATRFRDDAVYRVHYLDGVMGRPALLSAEVCRRTSR